jgi:hypothetical protein
MTPYEKSSLVYQMINEPRVSHRQAFRAVHISSSIQRYKKTQAKKDPLITLLQELVEKYLPKNSRSFSLGSAAWVTGGTTRTYIACVQPLNSLSAGEEKGAACAENKSII